MSNSTSSRKTPTPQPAFEVSSDFVVHDNIRSDLLGYYDRFPCKISSFCLCYVVRGNLRAKINVGEFDIHAGDLIIIIPGSFLLLNEVSEDVIISFEGYSSNFLKKINFWKSFSPLINHVFQQPVFSLNEEMGNFYRDSFSIMCRVAQFNPSFMTESIAQSALTVAIDMLANAVKTNMVKGLKIKNSSRDQTIVGEFMQQAIEHYRSEHKIAFYAQKASLTLSHFCNVISKTTGMTAQQIIMNMIIMDAKTQLRGSKSSVATIAHSLGFSSATTFTRYFKTYTGITPQEYRNKAEHN